MMAKDPMQEAADAVSDLNIFAAVVKIMEGSLVTAACFPSAQRIIKLAIAEQQRCLKRYDKARAKAKL
jgi:hypothetical protein